MTRSTTTFIAAVAHSMFSCFSMFSMYVCMCICVHGSVCVCMQLTCRYKYRTVQPQAAIENVMATASSMLNELKSLNWMLLGFVFHFCLFVGLLCFNSSIGSNEKWCRGDGMFCFWINWIRFGCWVFCRVCEFRLRFQTRNSSRRIVNQLSDDVETCAKASSLAIRLIANHQISKEF